ncbi:MAG: phosphate acyltransferase PlsX [Candidatus Goldbacteria bacterium]|nr:phosphate acyltransferase PlsX [Candidatus Goldiibacteriota bacterium]
MKIILDAMGSDNAPDVEIQGAVDCLMEQKDINIILTGKKELLEEKIASIKVNTEIKKRIEIVNASEVILMSDPPAQAFKQKPDSSIAVAAKLIKEEKAEALVSAGNTGAVVVTSLLIIGRIPGVIRPAICSTFPSKKGHTAVLDLGATVDCKPEHLTQFAIMGSLYAEHILNIKNPVVGLLSVGEEEEKGNDLSSATRELIKKTDLNFKGNAEGRDIMNGNFDVVVCDGFVGNAMLKLGEGIANFVFTSLKEGVKNGNIFNKIGALLMKPVFENFKKRVSYDEYGGALLLGIKKPVIITHGSANPKAIKNAIKVAKKFITEHINNEIETAINKTKITGGTIQ